MKPPAYLDEEGGEGGFGANRTKSTLSRELADFLVELSIAMQKHAIYPSGHPLLNTAVDKVMKNIALLLVDRDSLSIGIARRQLIIEGVGTDPNHPLLKELSTKLHKHNLGAIKFSAGLTAEELEDALSTIAVEPDREDDPLGLHAEELSQKWQYVRLYPLNYDRLQLLYAGNSVEGEERVLKRGTPKSAQLWVGMARAAMMLDDDAELDEDSANPLVVAEAIDSRQSEKAYDQVIVGYLLQIAEELKEQGGTPEATDLQKKISELVRQLSPESIRRLLQMGGDINQRRNFLLNASQGMTVEAVMDLVNAATAQGTQSISHSMMRLFSKLSKYAETDSDPMRRANAEQSMREQMTKLISEWKLDDPNPTAYGKVLQKMSRARAVESNNPFIDCEPERILQMGFELATTGPRFEIALESMLNAARLDPLLVMLDKCPDQEFAEAVWQLLDSRDILWAALSEARIDFAVLERIVRRKRLSAIEPILDVAERSKDARQRDKLLELLMELGDEIGPSIVQRLEVTRSDFRRDLFMMLGKLKNVPEDFDVSRFLLHTDAPVRREAIRLLLKFIETREQAIVAALTDMDERATFYGLQAAQEGGCPPKALALVRQRLEQGSFDSSLMTLAIRVIAAADSGVGPVVTGRGRTSTVMRAVTADATPAATAAASKKTMEWLISKAARQSRFLKKWELLPKSQEMLAALGALAAYWTMDPTVQEILNLCIKSNDAELKKALGAQRVTGKFKAITD